MNELGSPKGRRRRALLLALLAALGTAGLLSLPAFGITIDPGPTGIDQNLNNYVLFAYDELSLKGGAGAKIVGGHIGVNAAVELPANGKAPKEAVLDLCASNLPTELDPTMQVVAATMRLGVACTGVGEVFTNYRLGNGPSNYVALHEGGHPFPIIQDPLEHFPEFTADQKVACGKPKLAVNNKSAPSLTYVATPGIYGSTSIDKSYILDLTAPGDYTFCDLRVNANAIVRVGPQTRVFVVGDFEVSGGYFGIDPNRSLGCDVVGSIPVTPVYVLGLGIGNNASVDFGRNSVVWAQIWAKEGGIRLGHATQIHGRVWGPSMRSDKNVSIEQCGRDLVPTTTTTPTTVTTTSTMPPVTTTTLEPTTTTMETTTTLVPTSTTTTTVEEETTTTTTTIEPESTTTTTRRAGGET